MTADEYWYACCADGKPPKCRRLSRRPSTEQWIFPIDAAIELADGTAGYRQTWISHSGEEWWYRADGQWWIISHRIAERTRLLLEAAIRAGGNIRARLRRWRASGKWRRIVVTIAPRC